MILAYFAGTGGEFKTLLNNCARFISETQANATMIKGIKLNVIQE